MLIDHEKITLSCLPNLRSARVRSRLSNVFLGKAVITVTDCPNAIYFSLLYQLIRSWTLLVSLVNLRCSFDPSGNLAWTVTIEAGSASVGGSSGTCRAFSYSSCIENLMAISSSGSSPYCAINIASSSVICTSPAYPPPSDTPDP